MTTATVKAINKIKEPRVSCRVPLTLKRRLQKIAKATGIDESDVVRMALNRQLPAYETLRAEAA